MSVLKSDQFSAVSGSADVKFFMAERYLRFDDNVSGRYYVDEECIDCNLCSEITPDNFTTNLQVGHDYVYKQPETPEEEELCREALEACPVEAIGDDGEVLEPLHPPFSSQSTVLQGAP